MNYSELKTAIADYFHRNDLAPVIPTFIMLAEERMNRELRVRDMEIALTPTVITDYRVTVPVGAVDVKTLWLDGYGNDGLEPDSLEGVIHDQNIHLATRFAHNADELVFNGTGTVKGVLYEGIPALSDTNTTNWLLTKHPSVYLFGALVEAAIYTKDDKTTYEEKYLTAIASIQGNENRLNGPLVARKR